MARASEWSKFVGRLSELLELAELSGRQASRLAGLAPGQVNRMLSAESSSVGVPAATSLAKVFGCSVGWLAAGEGAAPSVDAVRAAVARARRAAA